MSSINKLLHLDIPTARITESTLPLGTVRAWITDI